MTLLGRALAWVIREPRVSNLEQKRDGEKGKPRKERRGVFITPGSHSPGLRLLLKERWLLALPAGFLFAPRPHEP